MKTIFVALVLVAVAWQSADAVKCYKCGTSDSGCKSMYGLVATTSFCEADTCYKVEIVKEDGNQTVRGCVDGDSDQKEGCVQGTEQDETGLVCKCADRDLCNSATAASFGRLIGGFVVVATVAAIIG